MSKRYIQAQQLLEDSFKLAWQIFESGYRPNYIVGVWRGGAAHAYGPLHDSPEDRAHQNGRKVNEALGTARGWH